MSLGFVNAARTFLAKKGGGAIGNAIVNLASPVKQPQLAYMWELKFSSPYNTNSSIVPYYAKSISIPMVQLETIKRFYNGMPYTYTGKDTSPRVFRATFYDNQNQEVYRYFYKWLKLQNQGEFRNKYGGADQLQNAEIHFRDTSDAAENGKFIMYNLKPTEISDITLNYNESVEVTFDVIFTFDRIEVSDR